jgi:hypothetical protein
VSHIVLAGAPQPATIVVDAFGDELDEIELCFADYVGHAPVNGFSIPYIPSEDGCLISIWDAWNRFLRTLVLNAASGAVLGLSGRTYSPGNNRTEPQALNHLRANQKGKAYRLINDEPKWFDLKALDDIMQTVELEKDNIDTVMSALGASAIVLGPISVQNPLEEIRTCRNFVAHKSPSTLSDLGTYVGRPLVSLSVHLRQSRSGVETFSEWKECMLALAAASAQ